jgi:hypothetical protein
VIWVTDDDLPDKTDVDKPIEGVSYFLTASTDYSWSADERYRQALKKI